MPNSDEPISSTATKPISAWRLCGWVCVSVVILSVASCIVLSAFQSVALTDITVTAIDPLVEPKDHGIPLLKQVDALPDYELRLYLRRGGTLNLGAKPNSSAVNGLRWHLYEPVSVRGISTIRLQEQDKIISDSLAEVEYSDGPVIQNGYRFDFVTGRSYSTGLEAFFDLPIGKAIAAGFTIAILLLLLSFFSV
jgi:hypothetical protein